MLKLRSTLLYFSILVFSFSFSQTWEPVGGGLTGGDTTHNANDRPVASLCVYNNKLYAGGSFAYADKLKANHIACWNGSKWDTLSNGTNNKVFALCVYDKMLAAGGYFTRAGRRKANYIAFWNDTLQNWKPIDNSLTGGPTIVSRGYITPTIINLITYNGNLYAIERSMAEDKHFSENRIAKWTDKNWTWLAKSEISKGNYWDEHYNIDGFPDKFAVHKGKLYFSRDNNAAGLSKLYTWDGDTMKLLEKSSTDPKDWITCIYSDDSALFVAKNLDHGIDIEKWDGKAWLKMSLSNKWFCNIYALVEYKGKLYAGGTIDSVNGKPANGIACWDGKIWNPVGSGFLSSKNVNACVYSLCVYNGELYAAGDFNSSGGKPMMNIAKLNLNGTTTKSKK